MRWRRTRPSFCSSCRRACGVCARVDIVFIVVVLVFAVAPCALCTVFGSRREAARGLVANADQNLAAGSVTAQAFFSCTSLIVLQVAALVEHAYPTWVVDTQLLCGRLSHSANLQFTVTYAVCGEMRGVERPLLLEDKHIRLPLRVLVVPIHNLGRLRGIVSSQVLVRDV
jgi:hypothetical protein